MPLDSSTFSECPNSQATNGAHCKKFNVNECPHCWQCQWCGATGCNLPMLCQKPEAQFPNKILMHPKTWKDMCRDLSGLTEDKLRKIIREEVLAALQQRHDEKEAEFLKAKFREEIKK